MVYGCASKTVKCLVFFFNFLAFVCGLALIIAGVFGLVSGTFYIKILADMEEGAMNDKFRFVLFVAVGLGCALALLGCLGCCGAWCENQCLLGTFVTIMVILLLVQLVAGILALVFRAKIKEDINKHLHDMVQNLPNAGAKEKNVTCSTWRMLQTSFSCCGLDGTVSTTIFENCNTDCVGPDSNEPIEGCPTALWQFFAKYGTIIGAVILGFIGLELVAVIFGCCLCREIRKASDTY